MDYQAAYFHLFNAITDCIRLLQKAQQETEEMACMATAQSSVLLLLSEVGKDTLS